MLSRLVLLVCLFGPLAYAEPGDLWKGLSPGPYGVGFQFQRTVDPTRNFDATHPGTPIGVATWYPAPPPNAHAHFITQLDYRLLEFSKLQDSAARKAFVDQQAQEMVAWRHIGVVPLTPDQARQTFNATGRAVRNASHTKGKFPVVIILGGPWYLSTTAEFLASNGYLVVASVSFQDVRSDVSASDFRWSVENDLRDTEWVLAELRRNPAADTNNVTSLGHGGGGMLAMLLAMRNRQITAVANIDAGNFSSRTNPAQLLLYDPRLMRVPYLYLLTADTRRQSDQYSGFENMRFSRRYEVLLNDPDLRHHDLSNVGRAVSASLGIRGDPQHKVLKTYADIQTTLLNFLNANKRDRSSSFTDWLRRLGQTADYAVTIHDATEPAPALYDVLASIQRWPPDRLNDAHHRDPEAEIFSEDGILKILAAARSRDIKSAFALVPFATGIHPESVQILQFASAIAATSGDDRSALELATRCIAVGIQDNDWRARAAQQACRESLPQGTPTTR